MNKMEARYAAMLEAMRIAGEIHRWEFEPVKLRLAARTFYEPDFMVIGADGLVAFHEVKGHWEDDARVKVKCAAERYPYFSFICITEVRKEWRRELL